MFGPIPDKNLTPVDQAGRVYKALEDAEAELADTRRILRDHLKNHPQDASTAIAQINRLQADLHYAFQRMITTSLVLLKDARAAQKTFQGDDEIDS